MEVMREGKIEDWIWLKILDKMYEEADSQVLLEQIKELLNSKPQLDDKALESSRKRLTREQAKQKVQNDVGRRQELLYRDFEKVILDFQLKEHERFLQKFNLKFKRFDTDQDGVLNELEFKQLILSLEVYEDEQEVEHLLQKVDPYSNQKITYSEVVSTLSLNTATVGD